MIGFGRHFLKDKEGRFVALSEQGVHPFQTHRHTDQLPFGLHVLEVAKHKLPEAEDWLITPKIGSTVLFRRA